MQTRASLVDGAQTPIGPGSEATPVAIANQDKSLVNIHDGGDGTVTLGASGIVPLETPAEHVRNVLQLLDAIQSETRAGDARELLKIANTHARLARIAEHRLRRALNLLEPPFSQAPAAWAVVREDGSWCEPIETTRESAEYCAALYAKNSTPRGAAPRRYTIEPLYRSSSRAV